MVTAILFQIKFLDSDIQIIVTLKLSELAQAVSRFQLYGAVSKARPFYIEKVFIQQM